jgi:signal transduction histidine kinase
MLPTVEPELLVASCSTAGDVVHCNAAWTSVLGSREAPWAKLSDEDQEMALTSVMEASGGTLVTNQVFTVRTPDRDEPLPVLLNFIPVYGEGNDPEQPVRGVTISGEVMAEPASWMVNQTQRHRMEALGRMTMGVAHDLNNLLSGLIGHIELLKERTKTDLTAESVNKSLGTIEQAAEDGASLIEKLQRYIRQDTQEHFEPVDLPTLLEDCITLTQPYWYNEPRRQGIEIDVEKNFGDVPAVMGSASELREVFVNLILNAVQAMPDGGTLTFDVEHDSTQGVVVRVEDDGTGMEEDVQAHIFEPLFTTKGDQGTGMGLAASYGIVQEHEGDIQVDSEPGCGTTFTLLFPSSEDSTPVQRAEPTEAPQADTARVLVVDDEEMVRSIVTQLLSLKGHEIDQASSGAEALDCVESETYDIVFTDFGMPEMTGAELAYQIRSVCPSMPIVLLTGYTDTDAAEQDVEAILSKPFKLEELQATIRELVWQS